MKCALLLALAARPGGEAERVTRYEAHLERVPYKALHELEAAGTNAEAKRRPWPASQYTARPRREGRGRNVRSMREAETVRQQLAATRTPSVTEA